MSTVWGSSSACCALGRRPRLRYTAPRGAHSQRAPPHPAAMPHATWSRTMPERCTLDGFVITPIEPQGSRYAGTDHGRLFINEARTGVMAWWSMGRWTDRAAREAIIAHAMTMRSCTPPLRIIPSTQKPGKMPHLNPFWRGHCHGLASCLLPTRSVGAHLALCHVASHWVPTRSDHPTCAGPAQAPQYHRDQTVRGSDAKTALRPV